MTNPRPAMRVLRGSLLSFDADPGDGDSPTSGSVRYHEDGALWLDEGRIRAVADYTELASRLPAGIEVVDYSGKLMMPGFIDTHVHYVQLDIMASYGRQLLDWLNEYTFPEECRFAERAHAESVAEAFSTNPCGSAPPPPRSSAPRIPLRRCLLPCRPSTRPAHAGWQGVDGPPRSGWPARRHPRRPRRQRAPDRRLARPRPSGYTLTPRFAPTSTREQLDATGAVLRNAPDLHLQTHLSENLGEIDWVAELFPECEDYLASTNASAWSGHAAPSPTASTSPSRCDADWPMPGPTSPSAHLQPLSRQRPLRSPGLPGGRPGHQPGQRRGRRHRPLGTRHPQGRLSGRPVARSALTAWQGSID